jgi:hypothetical protein
MHLRSLGCAFAAGLLCSSAATAQDSAPSPAAIDTTSRVRFVAQSVVSSREPITGTVLQLNDTAMVVRWDRAPQDEPLMVPFRAVTSLDVSQGQVSGRVGRVRGARIGAGVGAGLGFVSGFCFSLWNHANEPRFKDAIPFWFYGLGAGTAAGTGIGTLFGWHGFERWKHVPLPQVGLASGVHGGATVAMSLPTGSASER